MNTPLNRFLSILLSCKTILLPFVTFIAVIVSQVAQNCCFRKKYHWACPTMQFWREKFFWKKWSEMQIKFFGTILLAKVYENQRIFDNSTYFRFWAHSPLYSCKRVFLDIGFRFRFTLRITSKYAFAAHQTGMSLELLLGVNIK